MDWNNLALVQERCQPKHYFMIRRLTKFCQRLDSTVVPDPYCIGTIGFEHVIDLVEDACNRLLMPITQVQTGDRAR